MSNIAYTPIEPDEGKFIEKLEAAIQNAKLENWPCCVCGKPQYAIGVWEMDDKSALLVGPAPKFKRFVIYATCKMHMKYPEMCEDALLRGYEGN